MILKYNHHTKINNHITWLHSNVQIVLDDLHYATTNCSQECVHIRPTVQQKLISVRMKHKSR